MAEKKQSELEIMADLTDFRRRVLAKEEIPDEELKVAIEKLRTFRDKTAAPIKEKKIAAAKKKVTKGDAQDFFGDLLK